MHFVLLIFRLWYCSKKCLIFRCYAYYRWMPFEYVICLSSVFSEFYVPVCNKKKATPRTTNKQDNRVMAFPLHAVTRN